MSAITDRRDIGLYDVPMLMSLFGLGMGMMFTHIRSSSSSCHQTFRFHCSVQCVSYIIELKKVIQCAGMCQERTM